MARVGTLVGRDDQLEAIATALSRRQRGGIVVAGPSGVGKTRLAQEALQQAADRGHLTEWAVATQAAASIPFGPIVHLLPDTGPSNATGPSGRLDLLRETAARLRQRGRGRPVLLGVDDAHLLDDASAALVHHVAATRAALLVLTCRSGERAPDAVTALWKDDIADRLELGPLSEEATEKLLEHNLGGQPDGATLHRLWRLTLGNPLFLTELVGEAVSAGTLRQEQGVWRLDRVPEASTRLTEVVQARLGRLPADARAVAEVVALDEPLDLGLLEAAAPAGGIETADRAGLLRVLEDPRRARVTLTHPLYAELLRGSVTPLRRRRLRGALAAALQATGARRRDDLLRLAVWQLEGGALPDPDLLVSAARQAAARLFDADLANRLADAAVRAGGGDRARLVFAQTLHAKGDSEAAERLLGELAGTVPDAERPRVALARGDALLRGLGDPSAALRVIADAESVATDPRWHDELAALHATIGIYQGRLEAADEAADRVLGHDTARPRVRIRALTAKIAIAAYRGETDLAADAADQGLRLLGAGAEEPSLVADQLLTLKCLAYRLAGRLPEAEKTAAERYDLAVRRAAEDLQAAWALGMGEILLDRGDLPAALRRLREAVAGLRSHGRVFGVQGLAWALGAYAQAVAWSGDVATAEQTLAESEEVAHADLYVPNQDLARTWVAAARGATREAVALADRAAERAAERTAPAFEAVALHARVRLDAGQPVVDRLRALAGELSDPLATLYADHALAASHGDPGALDRVAGAFADAGTYLLAAEAAADAARRYRHAGRGASADAASSRAQAFAARCGSPRTPLLDDTDPAQPLTPREREVAVLAGRGLTSPQIATRLGVSRRTVENHLYSAFAKLGVSRRSDLPDGL